MIARAKSRAATGEKKPRGVVGSFAVFWSLEKSLETPVWLQVVCGSNLVRSWGLNRTCCFIHPLTSSCEMFEGLQVAYNVPNKISAVGLFNSVFWFYRKVSDLRHVAGFSFPSAFI